MQETATNMFCYSIYLYSIKVARLFYTRQFSLLVTVCSDGTQKTILEVPLEYKVNGKMPLGANSPTVTQIDEKMCS